MNLCINPQITFYNCIMTLPSIIVSWLMHGGGNNIKLDIVRILNDIPVKATLLGLLKLYSRRTQGATKLPTGKATAALLPSLVVTTEDGEVRLDVNQLDAQFGQKFVQEIGNLGSFMDVLDATSLSYSEQATQFLLRLTRTFMEQQVDGIDRRLNTFVSTELVLYRMLMHCIKNYQQQAVDFLEQRRQEILDAINKYFVSLQPDPKTEQGKSSQYYCNVCGGVYYVSTL